jgi:hypothetical protein
MGKLVILEKGNTRLGNKLFIFASMYAWAIENGHALSNPSFASYASHYPALADDLRISPTSPLRVGAFLTQTLRLQAINFGLQRFLAKRKLRGTIIRLPSGQPVIDLPPSGPEPAIGSRACLLRWAVRNPVGMIKHREAIVKYLTPSDEIVRDARAFADSFSRGALRVGVHIRHTDYREHLGGQFFIPLEKSIEKMRALVAALPDRRIEFAVFSDEPREQREFGDLPVTISRGSVMQDLHRMSTMHLTIGPLSTFSLWAAYFGGVGMVYQFGQSASDAGFSWIAQGLPATQSHERAIEHLRSC